MTEQRTPYAATETALPSSCIADTPQDRQQTGEQGQWTQDLHDEGWIWIDALVSNHQGRLARILGGALHEIERLTTDVVQLRGLLESIQHAANADTMPADEALAVIRGLVEGVGR